MRRRCGLFGCSDLRCSSLHRRLSGRQRLSGQPSLWQRGRCNAPDVCLLNADCDNGRICIEGDCVVGCSEDDDCAAGEICNGGQCAAGCQLPVVPVSRVVML